MPERELPELEPEIVAYRLEPEAKCFRGPLEARMSGGALEPTSTDKAESDRRGFGGARLSLWSHRETRITDARALRGVGDESLAFGLSHSAWTALAQRHGRTARVFRDPLPADCRVGADGHCLISGLGRAIGEPKASWRDALGEIAKAVPEIHDA